MYTVEFRMIKNDLNALNFKKVTHTFLYKTREDAENKAKEILADRKANGVDADVQVLLGYRRENYADWFIARVNDYKIGW